MPSLYRYFATSESAVARAVRKVRRTLMEFSAPAPAVVVKPLLSILLITRVIWFFIRRVFYAEPLFKAYCTRYGRNVHTDIYLHWVMGKGQIILGDNVVVDGKCTFVFASRYADRPIIRIGNNSGVGAGCKFVVAKSILIGDYCRIASDVSMRDSDGHPVDADARNRGDPPTADSVRPIEIENNVWIGQGTIISPGVKIGEGCVVAAHSVVLTSVPPYTIIAGNPARKIGAVPRQERPLAPAYLPIVNSGVSA